MIAVITGDPLLVGLAVAAPTAVLGYLGYRRSVKLDRVAASTQAVQERSAEITQIIGGLNSMVDQLQEDNGMLRTTVLSLESKIAKQQRVIDTLRERIRALERDVGTA